MKNKALSLLALFFLLAAFAIPTPVMAMAKRPTKETLADTKIQPITFDLAKCYDLALRRSETVAISKESIAQAEADFFKASGELIGDADFIMTHSRQEDIGSTMTSSTSGGGISDTFFDPAKRQRQFTFHQPLFQGFRAFAAFGAAGSYKKQREQEYYRAKQLLFQEVVNAFYNVLIVKRQIEIDNKVLEAFQNRIKELNDRESVGRSRLSEVVNTETKFKMLKFSLARAEGELAVALHTLAFLTGVSIGPNDLKDPQTAKPSILPLEEYLPNAEKRPDVLAAKNTAGLAKNGIIEAQSGLWPQLSLDANKYMMREGSQHNIDWDLALTFDVPLSRGGENIGKIKESVSIWKKAKLSYQLAIRDARLDIEKSYDFYRSAVNQHKESLSALESAYKNYDLQKKDYARSLVNNLEVLDALENLFATAREENVSFHETKKRYWQLQVAAGLAP